MTAGGFEWFRWLRLAPTRARHDSPVVLLARLGGVLDCSQHSRTIREDERKRWAELFVIGVSEVLGL